MRSVAKEEVIISRERVLRGDSNLTAIHAIHGFWQVELDSGAAILSEFGLLRIEDLPVKHEFDGQIGGRSARPRYEGLNANLLRLEDTPRSIDGLDVPVRFAPIGKCVQLKAR